MKRVQSAKGSDRRVETLRKHHQHFATYLNSLSTRQYMMLVEPVQRKPDVLTQLHSFREKQKAAKSCTTSIPGRPTSATTSFKPTHSKHVSILQSARSIEVLPPPDLHYPVAVQENSTARLFRGAKLEISPRQETLNNPLFHMAEITNTENAAALMNSEAIKDKQIHEKFVSSMHVLKSLKPQLDLTYSVLSEEKGEDATVTSQLGTYYSLIEDMQHATNVHIDELLKGDRDFFATKLTSYTAILRSVLRNIQRKGNENEAIIIEIMWKLVIKLFDSAMEIHDFTINDAVEMTKFRVKQEIDRKRLEIETLKSQFTQKESKLLENIHQIEANFAQIQSEKSKLEQELSERQDELSKMMEISAREPLILEMQQMYRKMTAFLNDTELEQTRQTAALETVENLLYAAKQASRSPEFSSIAVQTEGLD